MSEMPIIHINLYIKRYTNVSTGEIEFVRAYKHMKPSKDSTPQSMTTLYSHKAKRYVQAYLYFFEFNGAQSEFTILPHGYFRAAIRRIGLDIR